MNVFQRISNGWQVGLRGLAIIRDNPKLIIYPFLNGISLITLTFVFLATAVFTNLNFGEWGANMSRHIEFGGTLDWVALFIMTLASTFITVFLQVALVYNIDRIFNSEEIDIMGGLEHSASRIQKIFAWSVFAATVGGIIRLLEENFGSVGRLASGIFGLAWSLIIYFVVPILTFENLGPIESARRSADIIRDKWGSSIGAGVTFAAFYLLGMLGSVIGAVVLWRAVHPLLGILFGFVMFMTLLAVVAAARSVYQTAAYRHTLGETPYDFNADMLDNLFRRKNK